MKLALVHAFTWPEVRRGGERLLDDLTTYLRGAGHTVDVYSGTQRESQFHTGPDGRTYRLRIPWGRALGRIGLTRIETFAARALTPLLLHRYDAVHAFTPTAALAAVAAGHPTVYTVLGHPSAQALPRRRAQRSALVRAVASATEVAALSSSAADAVTSSFGRRPMVLPPGVFVDRFALNAEPRAGAPRLLFSGDLGNPDKGLVTLLHAFDRVLGAHPDARLALSGPGRADRVMDEIGAARGRIEAAVDVLGTGTVADVPRRYRSAHVTLLPSRDEAFGIVLVESLACGTPVVGGTAGGAEDIVTEDATGRLVVHGDIAGLASAIEDCITLARDPDGARRRRDHAKTWDWSTIGPRYESLYASVAGRRRLPGLGLFKRDGRAAPSAARPSPS
ncbi:MAG TPA: glycosyltransferase [Actinomycetota bacterium]|nr:glycosyltransferase [Actinomycetota bacterium]